jgi:prolipoprotein diacylglyceryltransferase
MLLYWKMLPRLKKGTLFGLFLIGIFGARFLIEYVKEPQVAFEQGMALNMGQLLSIPFIVAGIALIVYGYVTGKPAALVQAAGSQRPKPATKGPQTKGKK